MKTDKLLLVLFGIIAIGVGYLALTNYRQQQAEVAPAPTPVSAVEEKKQDSFLKTYFMDACNDPGPDDDAEVLKSYCTCVYSYLEENMSSDELYDMVMDEEDTEYPIIDSAIKYCWTK